MSETTAAQQQATFTTVALHLLGRPGSADRGKPKKSEGFFLNERGEKIYGQRYRGRLRCKCAIGALIPDANYHEGLEGKDCTHPLVLAALGADYPPDPEFLLPLQVIHDNQETYQWANSLFLFAEKRGLAFPQELYSLVNFKD